MPLAGTEVLFQLLLTEYNADNRFGGNAVHPLKVVIDGLKLRHPTLRRSPYCRWQANRQRNIVVHESCCSSEPRVTAWT
jgi:hypothetical protein